MNILSSDRFISCLEYTTMALENINFENENDFKIVKTALKCLLNREPLPCMLPEKVLGQFHFLKNVLDHPSSFIDKPELCEEFIPRLKDNIISKREEIKCLTHDQKELRIRKCKNFQDKVNTYYTMDAKNYQNHSMKLSEYYPEIIKSFTDYLTILTLALSDAFGFPINYKFIPRISFHMMNINKLENLKDFKNKQYTLPEIPNDHSKHKKFVEEVVSTHLNELAEIGIVGTLIFVDEPEAQL